MLRRRVGLETLLAVTVLGVSSSRADISPHGQTSMTREADIEIVLPDGNTQDGRHGFQGLGYVLAEDPVDPTRQVIQATEELIGGQLRFEHDASDLVIEWEQYHAQSGGTDCDFFGLRAVNGLEVRLGRSLDDTVVRDVPGVGSVTWTETLPLDQWVRLRLEYTARSGPPGSNDGVLVLMMEVDGSLVTVATITDHDGSDLSGIVPVVTNGTTTSRLVAWRKLVWDATGQDVLGAADDPDSLWRDVGHQLGAMEPDGNGGVRTKMWVHYDVGLYGTATDYAADIEIDTSDDFSAPITGTAVIDSAGAFTGVTTFEGLLPNTVYHARAQLKRDEEVVATTSPSSFRTISVPGGATGKFHIIHGSCSKTRFTTTPASTFRTALSHAPDGATLVFSHVGDLQYLDQLLRFVNDPPGPDNPNATDALADRVYDQAFLTEEFHELASNATCWFMWDDHEVLNGWSAPGLGGFDEVDQAHFDFCRSASQRWWGNRLLDDTSPRTHFYYSIETAQCLFIYLDVRTHSDHETTLLGAEQRLWLDDLLSTRLKPLVFLVSPTTWSSGAASLQRQRESWHDHAVERDEIINHFLDNNAAGHLFLMSGDTHFGMHNTSEFQAFGSRVHGDWMLGTYSASLHSTIGTEWHPDGLYPADHVETFELAVGDHARGYIKVDIDETVLSVRIAFAHGVTGDELYCVQELGDGSADLDGDGLVGIADLLVMLDGWDSCADCPCCPADLDGNGNVDVEDLLILLTQWI